MTSWDITDETAEPTTNCSAYMWKAKPFFGKWRIYRFPASYSWSHNSSTNFLHLTATLKKPFLLPSSFHLTFTHGQPIRHGLPISVSITQHSNSYSELMQRTLCYLYTTLFTLFIVLQTADLLKVTSILINKETSSIMGSADKLIAL